MRTLYSYEQMSDERSSKLLITFVVFLVLFNYPLLNIVDRQTTWWGVPALYGYFFLVWALMIVVIARIVRQGKKKR